MRVLTVILFSLALQLYAGPRVIGYFANWGMYHAENPYLPADVPYEKLTHIQYAFFDVATDGTVSSSDSWADSQLLEGAGNLIELAHAKGVKVIPSLGGFTLSSGFPGMAASPTARAKFCNQVRQLIQTYNFDGVDIDWEFPSHPAGLHNATPNDSTNLVLVLAQLRDTLDAMGGTHKEISLAIGSSPYTGKGYLVEKFADDVDYISIMTYDFAGEWLGKAWYNSPLYDLGNPDYWSLDRSMDYWLSRLPNAAKLNIGVGFYGRSFANCSGAMQNFNGVGPGENGMMSWWSIDEGLKNGTWTSTWDNTSKVPSARSTGGAWVGYDDSTSVYLKGEYAKQNGFGGAIIWALDLGSRKDKSQPLLDALYAGLNGVSSPVFGPVPSALSTKIVQLGGWDLLGRQK